MKAFAYIVAVAILALGYHGSAAAQTNDANSNIGGLQRQMQKSNVQGNVDHLPTWMRNEMGIQSAPRSSQNRVPANPVSNSTALPSGNPRFKTPVVPNIAQDIPNVVNTSSRRNQGTFPVNPRPVPTPNQDNPIILPQGQDQVPDSGDSNQIPGFDEREQVRPTKLVETEFAGWREAGEGFEANRIGTTLRANWLMLSRSGQLEGRVLNYEPVESVLGGMQVHLIKRGQLLATTDVDESGNFVFKGVKKSTYTLVGFGPSGFFAFSFDAVPYLAGGQAPTSISVMAMPAPPDFSAAWIKRFGPLVQFRNYGVFERKQGADDPKRLYGNEGIAEFFPDAVAATSINNHQVVALFDGRIVGRIHQIDTLNGRPVDIRNTTVALTKGTEVVQYTTADNFGVFDFTGIPAGDYGLIAAGSDGIGAIGITVAENGPGSPVIDFSLANSEAVGWINQYLTEEDYLYKILAPRNDRKKCNCNNYDVAAMLEATKERYKYGCLTDNEEFQKQCQSRGGRGGNGGCGQQGGCNSCGQSGCNGGCGQPTDCQTGQCGQPNCLTCQQNDYQSRVGAAFRRCEDCDKQGSNYGIPGQCNTCQQNQGGVPLPNQGVAPVPNQGTVPVPIPIPQGK